MKKSQSIFPEKKLFLLSLAIIISCSPSKAEFEKPYRANLISFNSPIPTSTELWAIDTKELKTLEEPSKAQGKYFEILTGGTIRIDSANGSLTVATSTSNKTSDLRLMNKSGVIVPRDTLSLYALSAFFSFEQLFEQLDRVIPMNGDTLLKENESRFKIYLEPALLDRSEWTQTVVTPKLNAAFNPENNDFYLLKSSELERIPLAANQKVIAHEFGHLIFKKAFDAGRSDKCQSSAEQDFESRKKDKNFSGRWAVEYSISGINEGYADFFSYVFTQSKNSLGDAFGDAIPNEQKESRSLIGPAFKYDQLINDDVCSGRFYCIGTLFARALYQVARHYEQSPEQMTAFSHNVYKSLSRVRELLKQQPFVETLPLPSTLVTQCGRSPEINLPYDGAINSAFIGAFLSSFPIESEKRDLCRAFEELFGERGFNQEARRVCTT